MPTNRKSETARANGAMSTGPATPEGKARSSQNALKHGLHSKQILLPTESAEEFHTLRDSYFDQFQPATPVEAELVESLAATRWRLRRLATIEANMFRNNILEKEQYIPEELEEAGEEGRLAWSFKNMADNGSALQVILRYEATLSRTYDRAFKQLHLLQMQRPASLDGKQQNEPTEPPSHPSVNGINEEGTALERSLSCLGPIATTGSQPASGNRTGNCVARSCTHPASIRRSSSHMPSFRTRNSTSWCSS
jgi:hypothetical protein